MKQRWFCMARNGRSISVVNSCSIHRSILLSSFLTSLRASGTIGQHSTRSDQLYSWTCGTCSCTIMAVSCFLIFLNVMKLQFMHCNRPNSDIAADKIVVLSQYLAALAALNKRRSYNRYRIFRGAPIMNIAIAKKAGLITLNPSPNNKVIFLQYLIPAASVTILQA